MSNFNIPQMLAETEAKLTALEEECERLGDLFDDLCHFPTPEGRSSYVAKRLAKSEARIRELEAQVRDLKIDNEDLMRDL